MGDEVSPAYAGVKSEEPVNGGQRVVLSGGRDELRICAEYILSNDSDQ